MSSYAYVYVWDITTFQENYKYMYVQLRKTIINCFLTTDCPIIVYTQEFYIILSKN